MKRADNPFRNLNALIVEDVSSMRQLLVALLKEIGFETVMTGEDGADALKKVEHSPFPIDMIVLDLEMPILNGIEFIQMLRRNSRRDIQNIPVIVVTGHSEQRNLHQAVHAGIHGFLVKPVSRKSLESRCRAALKGERIDPAVFEQRRIHNAGQVEIIEG